MKRRKNSASMYFFRSQWGKYYLHLPVTLGGQSEDKETSASELWRIHGYRVLICWRALMRYLLPPDISARVESFQRLVQLRRDEWLVPGGWFMTKAGKRRERRPKNMQPPSRSLILDHLEVSKAELRMVKLASSRSSFFRRWLLRAGVLKPAWGEKPDPKCPGRIDYPLASDEATALALAGTISIPPPIPKKKLRELMRGVQIPHPELKPSTVSNSGEWTNLRWPRHPILKWVDGVFTAVKRAFHGLTGGVIFVEASLIVGSLLAGLRSQPEVLEPKQD